MTPTPPSAPSSAAELWLRRVKAPMVPHLQAMSQSAEYLLIALSRAGRAIARRSADYGCLPPSMRLSGDYQGGGM